MNYQHRAEIIVDIIENLFDITEKQERIKFVKGLLEQFERNDNKNIDKLFAE